SGGRGGISRAHRSLPARAATALLPDPRLHPGRRGHAPGDTLGLMAWTRRIRGAGLAAGLALPDRYQPLPEPAPRLATATAVAAACRAGAARDGRAALARALSRHDARGYRRHRARTRRALRGQGGDRACVRDRSPAPPTAPAGCAGLARRARFPGER